MFQTLKPFSSKHMNEMVIKDKSDYIYFTFLQLSQADGNYTKLKKKRKQAGLLCQFISGQSEEFSQKSYHLLRRQRAVIAAGTLPPTESNTR